MGMFGAVMQDDNPERRVPGPELPEPLPHDGGWADDEAGLEHVAAVQACQEDRQLDGLAKPHFIPDDPPCSLSV